MRFARRSTYDLLVPAAIAARADPARLHRIARGSYLANGVARCFWCHSPLDASDPAVPRPEKLGSGDILDEKKPIIAPKHHA